MDQFTAKKLAEVQAFLEIGQQILDKSSGLDAGYPEVTAALKDLAEQSVAEMIESDMDEVFTLKVAKTKEKLGRMMELYIGDEWDTPVEVLEWSSFYSGAGMAHAALVSQLYESAEEKLVQIQSGFEALLEEVVAGLQSVGASRGQN